MAYISIEGNPLDGYEFHGPFATVEAAGDYGDYVAKLTVPAEGGTQEINPAYPIGHVFWVMNNDRPVEMTLVKVTIDIEKGRDASYTYCAMDKSGFRSTVNVYQMALDTKEKLLASL
jgi:hypothetical protein